ncbi:MAG: FAD-binding oxidoreductase [Chloroflexi bacterium]|nr:FAD-binding oxidoreductase [Chloroflexota bacterium]MBM3175094.1 FAD-binding oxidoreductase [Chloroflexota bacterium]MBM4450477.1 FAD-binding oxidoreductase [Chloroflexota bacterium]
MADVYESLVGIVGKNFVSNSKEERYFYARDPGLMPPHEPDYVVMPKTTEEVQQIVKLANRERVPIVPMGGGMALTGLVIPLKGGIVMDMKRMDKILEVNEKARYVVVEGGVPQGMLKEHLKKHHPDLRHSIPESPPITTIAANVVIHGQGRLTQQYGFNSDMVNGLEVVLPTGEICKIGSCAVSPYWFSKGPPMPDLSGLFLGWLGTTGIITKLGLKLYPRKKLKDMEIFVTDNGDLMPDIIYKITQLEVVEDLTPWTQPRPRMFEGNYHVSIFFTGDTEEELEFKRKMVWYGLKEYIDSKDGGFMMIPAELKATFMANPAKSMTNFADVRKGGGFEYSGPIIPTELYPSFVKKAEELAARYRVVQNCSGRVIQGGHCMMFSFAFTFNRADMDEMDRARKALHDAAEYALEKGGVLWKPTIFEQKMMIQRMDPNTLKLMKSIKRLLDPNGIMNPGNWEVN